ncbi:hypothetical protein Cni_G21709 [Canna indica]|uniref:CBS domain-containing protein n=1 Tax=Canna indica TaxID=4628 RepID=A0AAQ3KQN2_9LILI|nr:hypothetical protein Cni_G21709 [Canna indica]
MTTWQFSLCLPSRHVEGHSAAIKGSVARHETTEDHGEDRHAMEDEARPSVEDVQDGNQSCIGLWKTFTSIVVFSPIPALSIDALDLVRSAEALTIRHDELGLTLLPLICRALVDQIAVVVVTEDGRLLGKISPTALSTCDETATLTAGDLMSFIDYYGSPPNTLVRAIKIELKKKGLLEMLELMEDEISSLSNSSSSASSSSSDKLGGWRSRKSATRVSSSLVAAMVHALAYRVSYLWVVDEEDYGLMGIVTSVDMLRLFREQLQPSV